MMSNQYSGRHPNDRQRSDAQNRGGQARKQGSDTLSQVSDGAQSATSTAKKAASEAASTITDQVKGLLGQSVGQWRGDGWPPWKLRATSGGRPRSECPPARWAGSGSG